MNKILKIASLQQNWQRVVKKGYDYQFKFEGFIDRGTPPPSIFVSIIGSMVVTYTDETTGKLTNFYEYGGTSADEIITDFGVSVRPKVGTNVYITFGNKLIAEQLPEYADLLLSCQYLKLYYMQDGALKDVVVRDLR